jgi:hypothetical protein
MRENFFEREHYSRQGKITVLLCMVVMYAVLMRKLFFPGQGNFFLIFNDI